MMPDDLGKLRPSAAAWPVAFAMLTDLGLIGVIVSEIFLFQPAAVLCGLAAIVFAAAFMLFTYRLIRQAPGREGLYLIGRAAWLVGSTMFWAVAAGLTMLAIGFAAAMVMPGSLPVFVYAMAFLSLLLGTWAIAQRTVRRRRMLLILGNLEKSVRLDLPLPRMILAAAESEKGVMRRRLFSLADELDHGESIDQALIRAVPEVPLNVARTVATGLRLGCLQHVLEETIRRRYDDDDYRPRAGFYWVYPVIIFIVIAILMIAVMPKYQGIYRDFRLELPPVTSRLIELSTNATSVGAMLLLIALIPVGQAISSLFPSFREAAPFDGIFWDQLVWWTPVAGGYVRDRGMAELCDILSAGVRAGHPITDALTEAAEVQPNYVLRYRASAWSDAVARGQSLCDGARYARMPPLFIAMMATVRGSDSLLEVLGFLRRHYEYRFSRARAVIASALVPVVVVVLGSAVALVGVSMMQPIARLCDFLSAHYQGGF